MIYLDNASTTPVPPEVLEEMLPFYNEHFVNPMSIYATAKQPRNAVELARERFAQLINVSPANIIFTSSCTEANNAVLKSILETGKKHIITTQIEHSSVRSVCSYLETKGIKVDWLNVDSEGLIDPEELKHLITPETYLVSIIHANNEIGTLQDIEKISAITQEKGVPLHIDATQSISKIPIDAQKLNVDFLSVSAHKLHGPKGVGGLYIKHPDTFVPFVHGGIHENNLRAGTHNVHGIVGFGKACDLAQHHLEHGQENLINLQKQILDNLKKYSSIVINGPENLFKRVPGNINFSIQGFQGGESLVLRFSMAGIAVSSGSACASGSIKPSHVLKAIGKSDEDSRNAIRATLSYYNTLDDIQKFDEALQKIMTV